MSLSAEEYNFIMTNLNDTQIFRLVMETQWIDAPPIFVGFVAWYHKIGTEEYFEIVFQKPKPEISMKNLVSVDDDMHYFADLISFINPDFQYGLT